MRFIRKKRKQRPLTRDLIDGAVAGAVATWVMGKTTSLLYERESKVARQREDRARGGKTSYAVAAEKTARMVGVDLPEEQVQRYGSAIHWTLGIGAGALYGALRPRFKGMSIGRGLGFGTVFWLVMDEVAVYALRLTPGPKAFPWQAHARGFAGHLSFGAVTDATLGILRRAW